MENSRAPCVASGPERARARDSNIAMTEPETTPDETGVPVHLHGGQNVHESAVAAGEAVVHTAVLTNAVAAKGLEAAPQTTQHPVAFEF